MDALPLPELKLIAGIARAARRHRSKLVRRGIGDDAAVLVPPRGHDLLVTTDLCVEDVHFRRAWHPAEVVGHRVLARGLSDIAAMGGAPAAAFLSLALPARTSQRWVDDFMRGLLRLARRHRVELAGGDIAESKSGMVADITLVGSAPAGRAILRSGARPGDIVCVSGTLGGASRELRMLRAGRMARSPLPLPQPRLQPGQWLREHNVVSAMIDLSDGLSTDLAHICEESGVGARLIGSAVPIARGAAMVDALHGGEDYELLFTVPKPRITKLPKRIAGVPVRAIGEITRGAGIWIRDARGHERRLRAGGWQHFSPR